jgi:hypothetical protein
MRRHHGQNALKRARLQALTLFVVFSADGLITWLLGGLAPLGGLYIGLGVAFALARLALERRRHRPQRMSAEASPSSPARRTAVGYVQVPGHGERAALAAHHSAIDAYAESNGLDLTAVVHDVERPAGEPEARAALRWALERVADGDAEVLVVARLTHLSDTIGYLSTLLRWFSDSGRTLVAIDLRLDTSTPAGRLTAATLEGVAEGPTTRRPRPGRVAVADRPNLQRQILAMHERGMSLQAIADRLNQEGVPTVRGGVMWRPSSVQRAVGYQRPRRPRRGIEVPRSRPDAPGA